MLYYALVFLTIALVAGALGFSGIVGMFAAIAKVLSLVFVILFVGSLFLGKRAVPRPALQPMQRQAGRRQQPAGSDSIFATGRLVQTRAERSLELSRNPSHVLDAALSPTSKADREQGLRATQSIRGLKMIDAADPKVG